MQNVWGAHTLALGVTPSNVKLWFKYHVKNMKEFQKNNSMPVELKSQDDLEGSVKPNGINSVIRNSIMKNWSVLNGRDN